MDLSFLNTQQKEAVTYDGGHIAVVAGPGAGKSKSLVTRVALSVDRGVPERNIYVSTFTNKAAEEFAERLSKQLGEYSALSLQMGTFHSICNTLNQKLLTKALGNTRRKGLVKSYQVWNLIRKLIKHHDLATKDVKLIIQRISLWKNDGMLPEDVEKDSNISNSRPQSFHLSACLLCYKEYEAYKRRHNLRDFDDMMLDFWLNLKNPRYSKAVHELKKDIHEFYIDEGQDQNKLQYMIMDEILKDNNKTIVRIFFDDYQSIYRFRGASVEELKAFIQRHNLKVFNVEQNYRSTKYIVQYGNNLIGNNTNQMKKNVFTNNPQGCPYIYQISESPDEEAQWVTEKIEELMSEGFEFNQIAILMRINSQSRAITDQFVLNNIPHYVHGNYSFYNRTEVKDIVAYCRILYNPKLADMKDFKAIINKPTRYLSGKVVDRIDDFVDMEDYETFWDGMYECYRVEGLKDYERDNLEKLVVQIKNLHGHIASNNTPTSEIIRMVVDNIGYGKYIQEQYEDADDDPDDDKGLNISALYDGANRFPNPLDWFQYIETVQNRKNKDTEDSIQVMSCHASKGKEFDAVFVIGMCDRIYPFYKSIGDLKEIEEERRVAFVAITRARERLYLSALKGKFGRFNVHPSPFIKEIDGGKYYEQRNQKTTILRKASTIPIS